MSKPIEPHTPVVLLGNITDLESDCACPVVSSTNDIPTLPVGCWTIASELHSEALTEGWSLYYNPLMGGFPAVLNGEAVRRLDSFITPQPLSEPVDHRLAEGRLVIPEIYTPSTPDRSSDTLTAWLHITNACNLECPYCYIHKSAATMRLEDGIKAVDVLIATAQRRGFRGLKLKYAGGEAALHFRMIQQLHTHATERAYEAGITFRAVVLSNGTVIPASFAEWLAASGVRLMLSVDGVGSAHDAQRPWKGGRAGAFAALERNLYNHLLPRGVRPDICITVTGSNATTARHAVAWAIAHDLPFSLNFYRETSQSITYKHFRFEEQQLIAGILGAYSEVEQALPEYPILDGLLDLVRSQAHSYTCGVGHNYVVITHEGRVAQCQMDLLHTQPFNTGTDLIELVATGPIRNYSVDDKEGCRSCVWRYRCGGGCSIVTLHTTGRADVKSPNCNIYKTLIPAALRLEGLRLLKLAQATSA